MALITDKSMTRTATGKDLWITEDAPRGHGRFCARITKQGERLFYFRYSSPEGKREYITLGKYDSKGVNGLTLKDARAKATTLSQLYLSGIKDVKRHLAEHKMLEDAKVATEKARYEKELADLKATNEMTVNALFKRWKKIDISKRKDGGDDVTRIFNKDVLPVIGEMPLSAIKKGHVANIVDAIISRNAPRMAKVCFSLMRQMFVFAIERDLMENDPTAGIRKSKIGGKDVERDRVLSEDEIKQLAQKFPESGLSMVAQSCVWITMSTCCRIGELLNARWSDVDFKKKTWTIPAENSKNQKAFKINLSEFTLSQFKIIQTMHHDSVYVYPNRDNDAPVNSKTVTKQVTDRQRETPLSKRTQATLTLTLPDGRWTMHDLRRTGATIMSQLGIKPEVIERCLNHIEPNRIRRTYQRYSYEPEMKQAWELLGDRVQALTSNLEVAKVIRLEDAQ